MQLMEVIQQDAGPLLFSQQKLIQFKCDRRIHNSSSNRKDQMLL